MRRAASQHIPSHTTSCTNHASPAAPRLAVAACTSPHANPAHTRTLQPQHHDPLHRAPPTFPFPLPLPHLNLHRGTTTTTTTNARGRLQPSCLTWVRGEEMHGRGHLQLDRLLLLLLWQ